MDSERTLELCHTAYKKKDYKAAKAGYLELAELGNDIAQLNLGLMYCLGTGVEQDEAQAAAWLQKSAEQKNPVAQSTLGAMYCNGDGVAQDKEKAMDLFEASARKGCPEGQLNLGMFHEDIFHDPIQAYGWYSLAAKRGHLEAEHYLASIGSEMDADARVEARFVLEELDKTIPRYNPHASVIDH